MEKFIRVIAFLKEAKSAAHSLLFGSHPPQIKEKVRLLGLLDQIQSLIISIRADFIEVVYFSQSHPGTAVTAPRKPNCTATEPNKKSVDGPRSNVVAFDRRRSIEDRRKLQTYLAQDRRSGIADRRRKRRKQLPGF